MTTQPSEIKFTRLDVRDIFAKKQEPFPIIMKTVHDLKERQGLEITAPFLPSPLIEKLKSEGFLFQTENLGNGCWSTKFWKDSSS